MRKKKKKEEIKVRKFRPIIFFKECSECRDLIKYEPMYKAWITSPYHIESINFNFCLKCRQTKESVIKKLSAHPYDSYLTNIQALEFIKGVD